MAIEVSRRQLMASAGGAVLASFALPPSLRKVLAGAPAALDRWDQVRLMSEIEHVVVLMQENRSFDHYFGAMPGVRGFADPAVNRSRFFQADASNPDKYLLPFHVDTHSTAAQSLPSTSHSWGPQHACWNNGKMNGFVTAHLASDGVAGQYTMAYYQRNDIPFHWALADAFTVCDGYHCSMMGPTWPNRMYLMTGMIDPTGANGGPVISNVVPSPASGTPYTWTTYSERLTSAGISWRVYQEEDDYGTNVLEFFEAFQSAKPGSALYEGGLTIYPPDR